MDGRNPPQARNWGLHSGLPAEAELLLMIKGPLLTQAEKSSSDPRWKERGRVGHSQVPEDLPKTPCPPLCSNWLYGDTRNRDHASLTRATWS